MSLGISRTRLGGVLSHGLATNSRVSASSSCMSRRTASTTAGTMMKKGPVTAKTTAKTAHLPPPSASRKGATPRAARKKATSPAMETAQHSSEAAQASGTQSKIGRDIADVPKKYSEMSDDERLKEVDKMLQVSELMPMVDPFGQDITDTLDVMIPLPSSYSLSKDNLKAIRANTLNYFKNSTALTMLAQYKCLPGFSERKYKSKFHEWSDGLKAFGTQSLKPDAYLAPFRQVALELYEEMNRAVAARNEKDINRLTTKDYRLNALSLLQSSRRTNPKGVLIWNLHRLIEPIQVLSLRASPGYMAEKEPKVGNRLLAHALVKFHTEQSLEMYNARGQPLHTPVSEDDAQVMVDAGKVAEKWRVPAQRKRVTEYLVMEKRYWVLGPWTFRQQMWPAWNVAPPESQIKEADGEKS